ncbi:hypothetical protein PG991_015941 [Apiospora marii]|uniref:Transcription factor domain-containing protein n=1 Tax=Apiospora marii TaxID=335849 RepID=A0ABR1R028_9PEZI
MSCTGYQPSQLGAALAVFAYKVDRAALELLQRFLTTFNKTVTYRFQDCVSFEPHQTVNTTWLLEDEAYLHSVLLVASAMWEEQRPASPRGGLRRQNSTRTGHYMSKTLASLREGLSAATSPSITDDESSAEDGNADQATRLSTLRDSRISVVATLVILSTLVGDTRALRAHVAGLNHMVRLRGGLGGIRQNPSLYAKLRRVDVLWSLYSGERPLFLLPQPHDLLSTTHEPPDDDGGWSQRRRLVNHGFGSPLLSPPGSATTMAQQLPSPSSPPTSSSKKTLQSLIGDGTTEKRLLAIFRAQQAVAHKLNTALATGRPLAEEEFRSLVSEAQCDLVALRERCATIPAECLRLALLVVLTTTMNLPSPAPRDDGPLPMRTTAEGKGTATAEDEEMALSTSAERYPDLAQKFETCIRSLEIPPSRSYPPPEPNNPPDHINHPNEPNDDDEYPDLAPDLLLWLLLVGAVSLYGPARPWLRDLWRHHVAPRGLTSWDDEVAPRLRRRWVWVDAVHDGLGRQAFEVLTFGRRQTRTTAAEQQPAGGGQGEDGLGEVGDGDGPRGVLWASGWGICPFRL